MVKNHTPEERSPNHTCWLPARLCIPPLGIVGMRGQVVIAEKMYTENPFVTSASTVT